MPSLAILKTVLRELVSTQHSPRQPEPDLIMDDPDKVAAFTRAGREDGVMAPVYLFHAAQISEIIRPGDTVVDLGCGPATQLGLVARLNPETQFIGVDLSEEMLTRARAYIADMGITNVRFIRNDISQLTDIGDHTVDAVMSTVVLHHLPDVAALDRTFAAVNRVLKPGGGLYLVDFAHLKSEQSILYFAYQYADRQPELFTLDYLYSLQAAFYLSDFKACCQRHLQSRARLFAMRPMPFMMAIKSPARRPPPLAPIQTALAEIRANLPPHHQTDVNDLVGLFGLGGLRCQLLR